MERFWLNVDRRRDDECWTWLGHEDGGGYGVCTLDGRQQKAHRVSYILAHGAIPSGLHVLHQCDTRDCVNPAHLFLGTHADNMADMVRKGRKPSRRGIKNGRCKLTPEVVLEIRATTGNQEQTARRYGLTQSHIGRIRRGIAWSHLDAETEVCHR